MFSENLLDEGCNENTLVLTPCTTEEADHATAKQILHDFAKLDATVRSLIRVHLPLIPDSFIQQIKMLSHITVLNLSNSNLNSLPKELFKFENLQQLHLAGNQISNGMFTDGEDSDTGLLSGVDLEEVEAAEKVSQRVMATNRFVKLTVANLSDNLLDSLPEFIYNSPNLTALNAAANCIEEIDQRLFTLISLKRLYLGGNRLKSLPQEVGQLAALEHLHLSDNELDALPTELCLLKNLRCLELHNNCLHALPQDLLELNQLVVLSLRNNPLAVDFVQSHAWIVPSLQELAGRAFLLSKSEDQQLTTVPPILQNYLESAHRCENPNCSGVYFTSKVKNVKFRDFCGKFRVPLLQYLCSPKCTPQPGTSSGHGPLNNLHVHLQSSRSRSSSSSVDSETGRLLNKVYLGGNSS